MPLPRLTIAVALLAAGPLAAQEVATGEALRAAVADNTVQGSMAEAAYAEFYDESGTIRGEGYQGAWTIEGDAMCFAYGADPATCWTARVEGDQVTWLNGDAVEGTGTIVPGNPNGF